MSKTYLFDTNILIDYLRNNPFAASYIENVDGDISISSLTIAELYASIKNNEAKTNTTLSLCASIM